MKNRLFTYILYIAVLIGFILAFILILPWFLLAAYKTALKISITTNINILYIFSGLVILTISIVAYTMWVKWKKVTKND